MGTSNNPYSFLLHTGEKVHINCAVQFPDGTGKKLVLRTDIQGPQTGLTFLVAALMSRYKDFHTVVEAAVALSKDEKIMATINELFEP